MHFFPHILTNIYCFYFNFQILAIRFFKDICFILKAYLQREGGREGDGERERDREREQARGSYDNFPSADHSSNGQSLQLNYSKLGASSGSPAWVQVAKAWSQSLLVYSVHKQEAGTEMEMLSHKLMPIWNNNSTGRGLICYSSVPSPNDSHCNQVSFPDQEPGTESEFSVWMCGHTTWNFCCLPRCAIGSWNPKQNCSLNLDILIWIWAYQTVSQLQPQKYPHHPSFFIICVTTGNFLTVSA